MTLAPVAEGITRWATVLAPARQLAEIVSGTEFVPAALRGNPDACCAAIMYGDEIGIEPMQALASIHVVDGRPQPSAELMRALILRAGHTITVHTATADVCRMSGLRRGEPESQRVRVEWTMDMARQAGLLRRQNWQQYPRAMLLARATSELARIAFPDAIKGLGQVAEDEPEALETWAASVPSTDDLNQQAQPTQTVRRKRTPRALDSRPVEDVPLPEAVPDAAPEPGKPDPPWEGRLEPWAPTAGPPGEAPPESPNESPQVAPVPISDSLRRSLMSATSRVGVDPSQDRDMRLALWSALLARPVPSGNALSRPEALTLLRRLNDVETGAVEWDYDVTTGAVTLRHIYGGEPPSADH